MIACAGIPGENQAYSHLDLFDIDWDLWENEQKITLWNTVAALMPAVADCRRRWVVKLDKLGFAVSTGSACASGKEQPSHVLEAMGYSRDESDRMLRFSAGWETVEADWDALLIAVRQAAAELKAV